jgi:tRNA threonylcarbamoyladenosine biosynthesis protein TsaB
MELIIDTATNSASLAVSREASVIAEIAWQAGRNHTVQLIPNIINLLKQSDVQLDEIDYLIVTKGPGTFRGLRVGLATALGLVFSLDIPIITISTLEAIAWPHSHLEFPICPIINAGRGEIAAAFFQAIDGGWEKTKSEYITSIDNLCSDISEQTIFCGEITPEQQKQINHLIGGKSIIPTWSTTLRRAGFISTLAWQRIQAGRFDSQSTLQALYLRQPAITFPK